MTDDGATRPLRMSSRERAAAAPAPAPDLQENPPVSINSAPNQLTDHAVDQETEEIRRVPKPRNPAPGAGTDTDPDAVTAAVSAVSTAAVSAAAVAGGAPATGPRPGLDVLGAADSAPGGTTQTDASPSGTGTDSSGTDSSDTGPPPPGDQPGDSPEPPQPTHRRGWTNRVVLSVAAVCSAAVLGTVSVGFVVVQFYDQQIERESIELPDVEVTRPPPLDMGTETWLLVGSDVRTGSDAAEVSGARSDTMMIMHLASDGSTTGVSIPRDLRVPIPAWTDDDSDRHAAQTDKINAAFAVGGPGLLVATLEQLSGIRIDHYAEIDFAGFQQMSSAIGGVEVCLTTSPFVERFTLGNGRAARATNLDDPSSGFRGQEGVNLLSGEQALAFVRQRHGFIDGDLSRILRQQAFLGAVFRQVTSSDVLLDPVELNRFLRSVTGAVVLDDDTRVLDLQELATRMRGTNTGDVTFTTVPISGQINRPVFYFTYDPWTVRAFFSEIVGAAAADGADTVADEQTPTAAPTALPLSGPSASLTPQSADSGRNSTSLTGPVPAGGVSTAPPMPISQMEVTVLNATSTSGLATKVASRLRSAGFTVARIGDAADGHHATTEVRYERGNPAAAAGARLLIAAIPGATAVPDSSLGEGEFTLVLGTDLADVLAEPVPTTPTSPAAVPQPYYTQAPVTAAAGCIL